MKQDERAKIKRKQCDSCQSRAQSCLAEREDKAVGGEGVKKAKDKEKWGVGKISKMVYGNARNRAQNERERE